jgi:multiple sugar transport system permease protein
MHLAQFFRHLLPLVVMVVVPLIPLLWLISRAPRKGAGKSDYNAYLYLYPAFIILTIFQLAPVFHSFWLSLFRDKTLHTSEFVGLGNYRALMQDGQFWASLSHTFYFVIGTVPGGVALALLVALLLNTDIGGKGIYRTIYFLPVVTSIGAISVVWKWIYNSEYGLLNHWLGLERFDWLQQNTGVFQVMAMKAGFNLPGWFPVGPSLALIAVIVMSVWKGLGYNVVIFLAGLQNIPKELYEVAKIDGAGSWSVFRNITWPLLSPTTYFIVVMTTISSFQVFIQIFMLYDGMPSDSTNVIVFYLYDTAFKANKFGYASAIAYALFGIVFILTIVQRQLAESRVHYQ